jgi:hypothetical protein
MTFRHLVTGFAVLCCVLACILPVMYLVTQDYSVVEKLPFPAVCLVLLLEFPLIPAGLIAGLGLLRRRTRWSRFGATAGLALGIWLTTVALGIPYCGFYPNLLALFILILFRGLNPAPDSRVTFAVIYVTNLILYPLIGWLIGWTSSLAARSVNRSQEQPKRQFN